MVISLPLRLAATASVVCAAVLAGVVSGPAPSSAAAQTAQSTEHGGQDQLIPLYDNGDAADWAQACSQVNGSHGGSWIIADVAQGQGPGSASVPAWATVINNCYTYGRASVIGYVWTDYGEGGQASIPAIEAQINDWYSFYPGGIAGIFFDGVSDDVPGTSVSNQSFYRTLASYVHTREGNNDEVVFNFGANPGSGWMLDGSDAGNADIVVTFEGSYDTPGENPYTSWTPAAWESDYPADDFAALIYNTQSDANGPQPATVCATLATQRIGYVYVGTWYDQLPPYFTDFLTTARQGEC
jgi:hypothetical protein